MKLNKGILGVIIFIPILMLHGCGGGGGGGGGGDPSPTLLSVRITPSDAEVESTITVTAEIEFRDPNGDLGGGTVNYTYENVTYSLILPDSLNGVTWGSGSATLDVIVSSTTGEVNIPCWLVDKAGNESNTVDVIFVQRRTVLIGTSTNDFGNDVAVDSVGNIFIAGTTAGDLGGNANSGGNDAFLIKCDSTGIVQWTILLGTTTEDHGYGVAVDSNDNVYVTGETGGDLGGIINAGLGDAFLAKFDPWGVNQWITLLGTSDNDYARAVALDGNDNVYVAGSTRGDLDGNTNAGGYDIFLSKFDPSGTKLWTRLLGSSPYPLDEEGRGVAVDSGDNIYVTGHTNGDLDGNTNAGPFNTQDIFLTKFDSSGIKQWTRQLGTAVYDLGTAIALDGGDNIYLTGFTGGDLDGNQNQNPGFADIFLAKYDSSGTKQWTRLLQGTADFDRGWGVAVNSNDAIYVTGHLYGGLALLDDVFLAKYDPTGNNLWVKSWGTSSEEWGYGVAVDHNDRVILTGYTGGDLNGKVNEGSWDIFLIQM